MRTFHQIIMKNIIFYKTENGKSPVEEFLDTLTSKQAQKVTWVLRVIRDLNQIPQEYFKKLVNTEIWEVRVKSGNNIFRILGFKDGLNFVVLTNGFQKKAQKTPKSEIELAERRMREYKKMGEKNG